MYNPPYFVTCVCQLLDYENGVCKVYYLQNIGENEDPLSYPKVAIKKETSTANYGSFHRIFTNSSVSTTCFIRSRGAQFETMNCFFFKLNFYIVQYKSLSLHEVNKPSTESYVVAVRHSMQIGIFKLISAGYPLISASYELLVFSTAAYTLRSATVMLLLMLSSRTTRWQGVTRQELKVSSSWIAEKLGFLVSVLQSKFDSPCFGEQWN